MTKKKIEINSIWDTTKSGKIKVLKFSHTKEYDRSKIDWFFVEFIDTKYTTLANELSIKKGTIFDFYMRRGYYGFIGKGKYNSTHFLFRRWENMMRRCYLHKDKDYKSYGAKGIKVDEKWHNFQNYAGDVVNLSEYNENRIKNNELELDKDIKILGNKIYSKDTCVWISSEYNNRHHAIHQFPNHIIIDILEGKKYYIENMKQFCRDNNWIKQDSIKNPRKNKALYKKRWYILYEEDYNKNKKYYDQYIHNIT